MTSTVFYHGDLRTEATHLASDTHIITDAPVDNQGKGEAFSPTDLVATALASCATTIMGIAARSHDINIDGLKAEVTKIMAANPRRISRIEIVFNMPNDKIYTEKEKTILERAALTCPVAQSLHQDLQQSMVFKW